MLSRLLTGFLLAPLVVLLFVMGPEWARGAVVIAAGAICLAEFYTMTLPGLKLERWVGVALGTGILVSRWLSPLDQVGDWLAMLVIPALVVVLRPEPVATASQRLFSLWAGGIYLVLPFYYGVLLATAELPWILYVLAAVWGGDTGAYFTGKFLGKRKLHPAVSPNKTVEGSLGGLAGSVLLGGAFVLILGLPLETWQWVLYALVGGALAQLGDLTESLVKRGAQVKDSGKLLPGHGGLLDRVDGVIFAFPFFAWVLPL